MEMEDICNAVVVCKRRCLELASVSTRHHRSRACPSHHRSRALPPSPSVSSLPLRKEEAAANRLGLGLIRFRLIMFWLIRFGFNVFN
ncbi:hypothetical protein YC2023_010245 [Brassica napus]|uniref:Uncharacterized protein n=1 Tax=Brassica oleracea TaxID=3712 RepID=A0A3P6EYV0_BRAOL|nr:unnamed protein product [Brassica oleracea]